jgi:hypothetical protein
MVDSFSRLTLAARRKKMQNNTNSGSPNESGLTKSYTQNKIEQLLKECKELIENKAKEEKEK